jgi:alcohol dehydrogenase class IV
VETEVAEAYARLSPDKVMADQLSDWLQMAGLPSRLRDCGVVDAASLAPLAAEAAAQWTAQFNPVAVATEDFARIYEAAW